MAKFPFSIEAGTADNVLTESQYIYDSNLNKDQQTLNEHFNKGENAEGEQIGKTYTAGTGIAISDANAISQDIDSVHAVLTYPYRISTDWKEGRVFTYEGIRVPSVLIEVTQTDIDAGKYDGISATYAHAGAAWIAIKIVEDGTIKFLLYSYNGTNNGEDPFATLTEAMAPTGITEVFPKALATTEQSGLMSADDKEKLDNMQVDLADYEEEGKVLPTLSAIFTYIGFLTHHRTIWDNYGEIAEERVFYHVFCCEHDNEVKVGVGYRYLVYDTDLKHICTYQLSADSGTVPDVILRAFGEALATDEKPGMMSADDKTKLDKTKIESGVVTIGDNSITPLTDVESPTSGAQYVRKDGEWSEVEIKTYTGGDGINVDNDTNVISEKVNVATAIPEDNVAVDNTIYQIELTDETLTEWTVPAAPTSNRLGVAIELTNSTGSSLTMVTTGITWVGEEPTGTLASGGKYLITILDGMHSFSEITETEEESTTNETEE